MNELPPNCLKCGKCKEVCIVEKLRHEVKFSVLERKNSFLCASCWRCMEICPVGIDIYSLMMEARKNKQLPESFEMSIKNILDTGYSMPMRGIASIREMYDLAPLEHPSGKTIGILLKGVKDRLKKA